MMNLCQWVYNNFGDKNNVINYLLYSHHFLKFQQVFLGFFVCFYSESKNCLLAINALKSLISSNGM